MVIDSKKLNLIKILIYGFLGGIGIMLSGNTLNFWLASSQVDKVLIGYFSLVALPYALKYFLALLIEKFRFQFIKICNYKIWLISSQFFLIILIYSMGRLNPKSDLILIGINAFFIALFTVLQYVILNANRINILEDNQQTLGSSVYNAGFRIGMLITGAGAIYISSIFSWAQIYNSISLIYLIIGIFMLINFKHADYQENFSSPKVKENSFIWLNPFYQKLSNHNLLLLIAFIFIYRMADNILITMINPFYLDLGFNAAEIARASKLFGAIMVIAGGLLSANLFDRFAPKPALLIFSFLHFIGHALFLILLHAGKNLTILYILTGYEAFTGGMLMTGYLAFISRFCKGISTAKQYAFLSSIVGLAQISFPSFSGIFVKNFGWDLFFIFIISFAIINTFILLKIPTSFFESYKNYNN